ncbi:MAG: hypothetical protein ABH822_02505 [Patescibacteria group bacterium]
MKIQIAIHGKGGQGVKKAAEIMMKTALLSNPNLHIALGQDYDTVVVGGISKAFLILSDEPIINPIVETPDIVIEIAAGKKSIFSIGTIADKEIASWVFRKETLEQIIRQTFTGKTLEKNLKEFKNGQVQSCT